MVVVIHYSSPRKLIYPMILFMTLWKRPSYWEENTSVLRKGWDWEEMNDYKGAQVKCLSKFKDLYT